MISDEAVEAAIEALRAPVPPYRAKGVMTWGQIARCVLEAAAPHIAAQAWDEGEAAGQDNADSNRGYNIEHKCNPYRSQV